MGLNFEQELTGRARLFGRAGWNDGRNESFAYTEVDNTFQIGGDYRGDRWRRPLDKVGAAFVSNGISPTHRTYLALGGLGFLLGDGALNYGHEKIIETYYTAHVRGGISLAVDYQHIVNPGYNRDRGPVGVWSIRIHFEDSIPFRRF